MLGVSDRHFFRNATLAILLGASLSCGAASKAWGQRPASCKAEAFAAADNDIRVNRDPRAEPVRVVLPSSVGEQIGQSAAELHVALGFSDKDRAAYPVECGGTYRIVIPNSASDLYVAEIYLSGAINYFFFYVHDRKTDRVTTRPLRIGAKWTQGFGLDSGLVKVPFVSFKSLLNDGATQIVFQERVHNGNMYNGVLYHFFEVSADLALTRVLTQETRLINPFDLDKLWVRDVSVEAENKLIMKMYEISFDDENYRRDIGFVRLGREQINQPFRVLSEFSTDDDFKGYLITLTDKGKDDEFIRDGYTMYY